MMKFEAEQGFEGGFGEGLAKSTVRITRLQGGMALLEPDLKSACGGCSMAGGCGTRMLSSMFANRQGDLTISNDFGGKVGDRIEIGIASATLFRISAFTYLLPLAGMVAGAVLGDVLVGGTLVPLTLSGAGLASGFLAARSLYVSDRMTTSARPVFCRKIISGDSDLCG